MTRILAKLIAVLAIAAAAMLGRAVLEHEPTPTTPTPPAAPATTCATFSSGQGGGWACVTDQGDPNP